MSIYLDGQRVKIILPVGTVFYVNDADNNVFVDVPGIPAHLCIPLNMTEPVGTPCPFCRGTGIVGNDDCPGCIDERICPGCSSPYLDLKSPCATCGYEYRNG